ncbi:hypothetical protein [Sinorhizobium sp. BG8]|uniref:hypothetical protein n=1 Tax=Sinorhizobium sp. BG8 TaxID=2613773 RepID=UPI00193D7DE6|nr:hypothetical protein [Sinorhizobium sp. BG8]QRM54257.1 hypothetical protein F3Y30_06585 [Sinorhizobium sp. BG8]
MPAHWNGNERCLPASSRNLPLGDVRNASGKLQQRLETGLSLLNLTGGWSANEAARHLKDDMARGRPTRRAAIGMGRLSLHVVVFLKDLLPCCYTTLEHSRISLDRDSDLTCCFDGILGEGH